MLGCIFMIGGGAGAQTTWLGTTSADWHDPANWSAGVPGTTTATTIPAGAPNQPAIGAAAVCGALTLNASAGLTLNAPLSANGNNGNISISGTMVGAGTFSVTGPVSLSSTQPLPNLTILSGSVNFTTATVAGDFAVLGGAVQIIGTLTVQGTSTLSGGSLSSPANPFGVPTGTFVVYGAVSWTGTTCTQPPSITCHGDWTATAAFDPSTTVAQSLTLAGTTLQTISGPNFSSVVVLAGTQATALGAFAPDADLTVHGSFSAPGLTALRSLTVSSTGVLNLSGTAQIDIRGHLNLTGSVLFAPASVLRFVSGPLSIGSASVSTTIPLPEVIIQKSPGNTVQISGPTSTINITGPLTLISGAFQPAGVTVHGPSSFGGGNLSGAGLLTLVGPTTWTGTTGTVGAIEVKGDWTSDASFGLPLGYANFAVYFSGSVPQTLSAVQFNHLYIQPGAHVVATTNFSTVKNLTVQGILEANSIVVGEDLSIPATGTLEFSGLIDIGKTLSASGHIVAGAGAGMRLFGSQNATVATPNPEGLPNLTVMKGSGATVDFAYLSGVSGVLGYTINGSLTLLSGTTKVSWPTTVNGTTTCLGGSLTGVSPFNVPFNCNGDVYFSGTQATSPPSMSVQGNWFADANFAPTGSAQTISFVGAGPQIVSGAVFPKVNVTGGPAIFLDNAAILGDLTVQGAMIAAGIGVNVAGNTTVAVGGSLDLGTTTHNLGGNLTVNGQIQSAPAATLVFDRGGTIDVAHAAGQSLPNVVVAKTSGATARFGNVVTSGNFSLQSGAYVALSATTHLIGGDAVFSGGSVGFSGTTTPVFDCNGDVTFNGASAVAPCHFRCAGNWSADSGFAPTNGITVELDGTAPSLLGPAAPGGALNFGALVVKNGRRAAQSDLAIAATSLVVAAGAELSAAGNRLALPPITMSLAGRLSAEAGGEIALAPTTSLTIGPTGSLGLVGEFGNAATVTGNGGSGYTLVVNGLLEAQNFGFYDMAPGGILVSASATLAASPFDLRGGIFDRPSTIAGSVLLNIQRPTPTDLRYIEFAATNGASAANVRVLGGAPITFTNWSGTLGGASFEDDPSNLVTWASPVSTQVATFVATPGIGQIQLDFTTGLEVDVARFEIERTLASSGLFSITATIPPLGSASSYSFMDTGLVAGQAYDFRLYQVLDYGARQLLGALQATPLGPPVPPGVDVGNGAYPNIQAAIDAATGSVAVIRVAPGTYPSFEIGPAAPSRLRIVAAAGGPVTVDTSAGPIYVHGLESGRSLELVGLIIGAPTSPHEALVVADCEGVIVCTDLAVLGGVGRSGVRVDDARAVAVQRTLAIGSPGLEVAGGSRVQWTGGSVDAIAAAGGSVVTICGATAPTIVQDGTASVLSLAGAMPNVLLPTTATVGGPLSVTIEGQASSAWALLASPGFGWRQFGLSTIELTLLLDTEGLVVLDGGIFPASGSQQLSYSVPQHPAFVGIDVHAQFVTVDPVIGAFRFSNVATATLGS